MNIVVDVDGAAGRKTATITATSNHPIWVPALNSWVPAGSLVAGQKLRAADGSTVEVERVSTRLKVARVHNISVADFETYYVAAKKASVLVHNAPPTACRLTSTKASPNVQSQTVWKNNDTSVRVDVENPNPGSPGSAAFHVQFKGRGADTTKYYYNASDGTWVSEAGAVLSKKESKRIPQEAVNKAMQYLGIVTP